jgi:NAD(P)H-dependent FMN reductase
MRIVCISSSLSAQSKSERLGRLCIERLQKCGVDAKCVSLKEKRLPSFDDATIYESAAYRELHDITARADGLIFASPVYNWAICAELKRYVECVGSTPPDKSRRGAFFDKVVTFVTSAGLPHSYMAFGPFALSMMMDFKCIINPHTVYAHGSDWQEDLLSASCSGRIEKAMAVMVELTSLLSKRQYSSDWEI